MQTIGIDIGSTTVKVVLLSESGELLFSAYERHYSAVREKTSELLSRLSLHSGKSGPFAVAIAGSAGLSLAKQAGLPFIQEVFACAEAVENAHPETTVAIELGGEDAKIIFFQNGLDERMNGTCAGGTGAFIDQMATLFNVKTEDFDSLYKDYDQIYNIASRCGVFAKSDIQPLLNQGASLSDLVASVYQAVVNQTIAGLAQGKKIEGNVLFLGGPLYYMSGLRDRFTKTLNLMPEQAIHPDNALFYVAVGAALSVKNEQNGLSLDEIINKISDAPKIINTASLLTPLFEDKEEYEQFKLRHAKNTLEQADIQNYSGGAYLGVDAGSTTTKLVLIGENNEILYSFYSSNKGNPVSLLREQLIHVYGLCNDRIQIKGSAVTGYGEDLIKAAFSFDYGIVETMAHYKAAAYFDENVEYIIDIGGQDMKCFRIENGVIDSIILNEACSSGCGSFLETFAKSLGYSASDFAQKALFSEHPADLGSRCTVFMNSSVKQAQKEGAGVDDISAGLAISVVKNALYKVIRITDVSKFAANIVVQGGTFLNDAVLRAFEREIGMNVTRPAIAGLMGAFGAALTAKGLGLSKSEVADLNALEHFEHTTKSANCGLCTNNCHLTVNTFAHGNKFISGNRCERPLGNVSNQKLPNLFDFKYDLLMSYEKKSEGDISIGLPMGLNMYENLPFWHAFFTSLGLKVVLSEKTTKNTYIKGQHSIPSDTVCYPAKLMHGHIESLIEKNVDYIFYPCLPYNFNEERGDNHYNCPVVAYYPELLQANMDALKKVKYLNPYFGLHRPKDFVKKAFEFFGPVFGVTESAIKKAAKAAYFEYNSFRENVRNEGANALAFAKQNGLPVLVVAGRPYHVDLEINHGLTSLMNALGFVVVSEDAVSHLAHQEEVSVLNQWTYHTRLYDSAKYVCDQHNMQLIQLVSFGCGIDAITTDEVKDILEDHGKLYTQLKIDEINNLGGIKIRLRSLKLAMEEREKQNG